MAFDDTTQTDEQQVPRRSDGRISALHARADKAWIYRVVAVQAQAGRTLIEALDACSRAIEKNGDEAGPHDEHIKKVLDWAVEALRKAKADDNLLAILEGVGFYLGSREQPFLDMTIASIEKDAVRASVFSALAGQLGG